MLCLERGVPAQARAERNAEEDDEFQRPRSVRFHDEQMYPISKEEREEHELLGVLVVVRGTVQ